MLLIQAKCSDTFWSAITDDKGKQVGKKDYLGCVPKWFPNAGVKHYGDYIELNIDMETGQIINWIKPTQEQLEETFKINSEEN